jgi:hypothetical protein
MEDDQDLESQVPAEGIDRGDMGQGPRLTSPWLVLPVPSAARRSITVHRSECKHVDRPTARPVGGELGGRSGGAIRSRGSALRRIAA